MKQTWSKGGERQRGGQEGEMYSSQRCDEVLEARVWGGREVTVLTEIGSERCVGVCCGSN